MNGINKIWLMVAGLAVIGASVAMARTRDHEAAEIAPHGMVARHAARPAAHFVAPLAPDNAPVVVCAEPAYVQRVPIVGFTAGYSYRPHLLGQADRH